jgi:hypothetical protein
MTALAAAALLLYSLSFGGCATSPTASSMDAHGEAPVSPKTSGYLPLDLPPRDKKPAMTADERLKLQKELIAARDRQASRAEAASSQPTKP